MQELWAENQRLVRDLNKYRRQATKKESKQFIKETVKKITEET